MHLTKDSDIRAPLICWLKEQHKDDLDTAYIHELKMPRPAARVDLAVVNGELVGYEIKSDRDRLDRLDSQIPAYNNVFEKMNLVTTKKHLTNARSKIPNSWGIIIFQNNAFRIQRKAKKNKKLVFSSLLFSLTVPELHLVCKNAALPFNKSLSKQLLVQFMNDYLKPKTVMGFVRDEIRKR